MMAMRARRPPAAARDILLIPEVRDRLGLLGAKPAPGTPEDLLAFMRQEQARCVVLVQQLGIKADS